MYLKSRAQAKKSRKVVDTRKVIMSSAECSCDSQTTSEGSESTLLVTFLHSSFVPQTYR